MRKPKTICAHIVEGALNQTTLAAYAEIQAARPVPRDRPRRVARLDAPAPHLTAGRELYPQQIAPQPVALLITCQLKRGKRKPDRKQEQKQKKACTKRIVDQGGVKAAGDALRPRS